MYGFGKFGIAAEEIGQGLLPLGRQCIVFSLGPQIGGLVCGMDPFVFFQSEQQGIDGAFCDFSKAVGHELLGYFISIGFLFADDGQDTALQRTF